MIPIPSCTVVTATTDGRVCNLVEEGTRVDAGDVVAAVESGGRTVDLTTPRGGLVRGFLANLAQPVVAGEGVVWLAPA